MSSGRDIVIDSVSLACADPITAPHFTPRKGGEQERFSPQFAPPQWIADWKRGP